MMMRTDSPFNDGKEWKSETELNILYTMIRNQKCASNSFLYYIGIFHLRRIEYYQTNYEEKRFFTSRLTEAGGNGRSANQYFIF